MNKRDFGSFHASNVEELIFLSEENYQPPDIPIKLPDFSEYQNEVVTFGKKIKQKHFVLGEDYTFINHGAFGAVIKDVLLVAQVENCLLAGLHDNTRLVVVDHIPSNTPFIMPIKEITDICHERNIKVLVDGAHALGQLDLNLKELDADFYATNCHKWLSACKGTALLYVTKPYQEIMMPLVISHGYDSGFISRFSWTGLHDYSPFLALHTALDFWISLKPATIRKYMHTLAKQVGDMLAETWETELLASSDMIGSMFCVQLPKVIYKHLVQVCYDHAETIQNILYHKFNIEVPVKVINNALYVRVSVHIYNTIEDYQHLAQAVIAIMGQDGLLQEADVPN
ncbi:hypothetical protein LSH36_9g09038 [Paralvinella palmiformis]|uniref:Aminotransferase class V domain-containing protein n=1 Tax=Paralvinella palmiformis TaxID=53620 RepID=A0AAD9NJJ3_9ANNE|nr:hypothetical protein LSH36_9g09038 [Paralvinella palmiformis]